MTLRSHIKAMRAWFKKAEEPKGGSKSMGTVKIDLVKPPKEG